MNLDKAGQDFRKENLPSNRKELFFDCIKQRFGLIMLLAFVLFLFALPLLLVSFSKDAYLVSIGLAFDKKEITQANYDQMYFMAINLGSLISIPCFLLFSVGLAGALRVIRQLVWQEGIFFKEDFFDGIKLNFKHYLIYGFIFGVCYYISNISTLIPLQNIEILKALPFIITFVIILPIILFAIVQSQIYSLTIKQEMKNGFFFLIKTFFTTFIATAFVAIPLTFDLIPIFFLKMLAVIIYVLFILPFIILGVFLYINSQLDKYLNKEHFPDIYRKGLVD